MNIHKHEVKENKMGMFDYIEEELFCPYCGEKNDGFQTKDLLCMLNHWTIAEIKKFRTRQRKDDTRIYTSCKKCKEWIEIVIIGEAKIG